MDEKKSAAVATEELSRITDAIRRLTGEDPKIVSCEPHPEGLEVVVKFKLPK